MISGALQSKILIVGDVPGVDDEITGKIFQGTAGAELRKMLSEAGIVFEQCACTNLFSFRPPDVEAYFDFKNKRPIGKVCEEMRARLIQDIETVKPNLIIALGGLALWALHGDSAISTWRGSLLSFNGIKVIPTYHPSQINRMWEWRAFAVRDLSRCADEWQSPEFNWPKRNFIIRPSFSQAYNKLGDLYAMAERGTLRLSVDLETRLGYTACIGIAWSKSDAICIPLMCVERPEGYWTLEEEHMMVTKIQWLLTHKNVKVCGQNFLYDAQYFAKENGYAPNLTDDTMFMQHVLFPGLPKGLDFLASMYCEKYVYWKGEGKHWDATVPEEQLWEYNCKDACYTFEISDVLPAILEASGLTPQYQFQMRLWWAALRIMLRGVRINLQYRQELVTTLMYEIGQRTEWLKAVIGHDLNPKSPKQMQAFFYSDCKLPVQRSRKGIRGITCDDEALEKLSLIEPVVAPVCNVIRELRTLGVFLSTFVLAGLSFDKRIRSSFNPAGTETFRFSSSKDAFDSGCNLQNIPRIPNEEDPDVPSTKLILPNIRKLFLPDPSHTIFDVDLAGADAQVVAWDAEDEGLKAIFRSGQKLHAVNAKDIFGGDAGVDGRTEPYYTRAKTGVHLTNYGGKARTCAVALGITIHEAERFQRRWFDLHPAIKAWHDYIENELQTKRQVSNKFGYRRFYFDRVENLLPEALAWIPQSTVAIVTNKQWVKIENAIPEIGILMQVHDSLVGQVATPLWAGVKPRLKEELRVIIPYADPLIIQSGLKTSTESWGAAQEEKW